MSTEVGRKDDGSSAGTPTTSTAGFTACVRYGFPEDADRPRQQGTLTSIYTPIPEGAITASPVYLVPTNRYEHQFDLEDPWAIKGNESCIAQEIQNECEQDQRVWYPVYVESDETVPLDEMTRSLAEFVRDVLDMQPEACTFYYSGGRSIHVHVPRFIETDDERESLKKRAERWNEESRIAVDVGIYSRKRQFRLPGVKHADTDRQKALINEEWDHARIFRAGGEVTPEEVPETYDMILETVFSADFQALYRRQKNTDGDDTSSALSTQQPVETPLEEQTEFPGQTIDQAQWLAYNGWGFSPYMNATGGRSVAVVQIVGTPFQRWRRGERNNKISVPAEFYGAVSCNGEYTKQTGHHAPLHLSKTDYGKYEEAEYEPGDSLVIIGGQSRSSRIFRVDSTTANAAGDLLIGEKVNRGKRRQSALNLLQKQGDNVGSPGYNGSTRSAPREHRDDSMSNSANRIYRAKNPKTPAGKLQRRAEQGDIRDLTHDERIRVANRLLKVGTWEAVWNWFEEQYGEDFKPDITYKNLSGLVNQYQYDVTVSPRP